MVFVVFQCETISQRDIRPPQKNVTSWLPLNRGGYFGLNYLRKYGHMVIVATNEAILIDVAENGWFILQSPNVAHTGGSRTSFVSALK